MKVRRCAPVAARSRARHPPPHAVARSPTKASGALDAETAGILLEVMRYLMYQTFVRKERLLQAMTFRRFVSPAPAFSPAPDFSPADIFARES